MSGQQATPDPDPLSISTSELLVKKSAIQGFGCFARRPFRKGEVIGEYTGERLPEEEADDRYGEEGHTYLFITDDGTCIDATHEPNPVKYINHCCDPNCESIERDGRVFIRALRDIKAGEELHYDYNLQVDEDDDDPCTCFCGSPKCRGTMKGVEE